MKVCAIAADPDRTPRLKQEVESLIKMECEVQILKPKVTFGFKSRIVLVLLRYLFNAFQVLLCKADIYHVHNNPDVGFLAIFKSGKLVYDVRNPWGREMYDLTGSNFILRICELLELTLTKRADVVIAANRKLAERAKAWGTKKIFIVPNYPPKTFRPTINAKEMKRIHNLEGKKIVMFTGNLSKVECPLDLVQLFPQVLEEMPEAVLVIVGDGEQKHLIDHFIKTNNLEENVRLIGRVPRVMIPNWLSVADAIVVPRDVRMKSAPYYCPESIWKVTEALSLGKPVISCPVGGFVNSSWAGIRVAPLENFHKAIIKTLKSPPKVRTPNDIVWENCEKQLSIAYRELGA